jgi:hypothetical protein
LQDEVTGKNAVADYARGLSWEQVHEGHKMVSEFLRGRGTNVTVEQLDNEIYNPPQPEVPPSVAPPPPASPAPAEPSPPPDDGA